MMSHAVANILFAIRNSVPKGTGKYWPILTAISAHLWHACMAAYLPYHILSGMLHILYLIPFRPPPTEKSADPIFSTETVLCGE